MLCAQVEQLTRRRDALQKDMAAKAATATYKEVEKQSMELALVQEELDSKELRWEELGG